MNAALQRAKDAIDQRRAARQRHGRQAPVTSRHQPLKQAMRPAGDGRCFLILYCPGCLRGQTVDLVREVPAGAPDARDMELRQMRPWRVECAAK
jgi:hypothetical protein